jgi:DNA-binding FadR family transcriptional regulator
MRRFKVSREPFREAVSILELQGIVRMERGVRGGLRVEAPALSGIASMIRRYVEFADISFREVSDFQRLLERYGCERAIERMTPAHANALRRAAALRHQSFRSRDDEAMAIGALVETVMEAAGSPSVAMLAALTSRLVGDFGHHERYPPRVWARVRDRMWQLATELAECVASRHLQNALRVHDSICDEVCELLYGLEQTNPRIWNTKSFLGGSYRSAVLGRKVEGSEAAKPLGRAIELAYALMADVRRRSLPAGTHLGSEQELLARYGVGRSTLREAIRTLEMFGMARSLRGSTGGLVVSEQNPSLVIDTAVLFIRYVTTETRDISRVLLRLAQEHGQLAARHVTHRELLALREAAREALAARSPGEKVLQLRRQWAALANNRLLALVVEILATARLELGGGAPSGPAIRTLIERAVGDLDRALREPNVEQLGVALSDLGIALNGGLETPPPRVSTRSR